MWNFPGPGIELVPPAPAGRFLSITPPGKPRVPSLIKWVQWQYLLFWGLNWNNRCRMLHILYSMYIYCCCLVALVPKLCLILLQPQDCSLPGYSDRGISQAKFLEWIAIPFSRGSSWTRDRTCTSCICLLHWQTDSLPLNHQGSPIYIHTKH